MEHGTIVQSNIVHLNRYQAFQNYGTLKVCFIKYKDIIFVQQNFLILLLSNFFSAIVLKLKNFPISYKLIINSSWIQIQK